MSGFFHDDSSFANNGPTMKTDFPILLRTLVKSPFYKHEWGLIHLANVHYNLKNWGILLFQYYSSLADLLTFSPHVFLCVLHMCSLYLYMFYVPPLASFSGKENSHFSQHDSNLNLTYAIFRFTIEHAFCVFNLIRKRNMEWTVSLLNNRDHGGGEGERKGSDPFPIYEHLWKSGTLFHNTADFYNHFSHRNTQTWSVTYETGRNYFKDIA